MRSVARTFVALWYLLGWTAHVYLGMFAPETYRVFGATALIPGYTDLWLNWVMPGIAFLAPALAFFEIVVGCLLAGKGSWVKRGAILSILFNLFLVQMGLGYPAADAWQSFCVNRLPNLLFIGLQVPLLWGKDSYSIPEIIQRHIVSSGKSKQATTR